VYYASRAAFEREERKLMAVNARQWLETNWGMKQAKAQWTAFFDYLESL